MTGRASRDLSGASAARTVAQAKVNLFLHVLAREANGYHQIETLFCRLELGDDVTVRTAVRGRSLDCAGEALAADGLGPVERNLAWRAAAAFADTTGWPNAWGLEITKRIPVGGGLGGGSADAAAVLRCLNALAPQPLPEAGLLAIAGTLGADVPFLTLDSRLALAWGRGERILALPALPARAVTLACFDFGVPTSDAYAWIDLDHGGPNALPAACRLEELSAWPAVAARAHNDFERVVARRHPRIAAALEVLRRDAGSDPSAVALLSGSGATVAFISPAAHDHDRLRDGRLSGVVSRLIPTRTASAVVGVETVG